MSGADVGDPFHIASEAEAWTGRRLAVSVVDVEAPDGSRHEREVVRHPGAVGIVPLHEDGTVTLVRQYRAAIDRAIGLKPKGHDFIIDRRHNRPSVSRHMSVTGG